MREKTFISVAGYLFSIIALVHLARVVWGWHVMVEGINIPLWVSWVAIVITGFLGYSGLKLENKF